MNNSARIAVFTEDLIRENQVQNLISRQATPEDIAMHVEDSLEVFKIVDPLGWRWLDIGTGGGFPGLVMALDRPDMNMTLLESDQKKSRFLSREAEAAGLGQCQVLVGRAEDWARQPDHREGYDACSSRAVADLRVLLEYAIPFLKVGGHAYFWKGSRWQEELSMAENALNLLGAEFETVHHYRWRNGVERVILVIVKIAPSQENYPRRAGLPSKKPL